MGELTPKISELHRAATAYYNNICDPDFRNKAWNFFKSMDTDGNERVSYDEFVQFFRQAGYNIADPNFFRCLDRNQDGSLDFWEVLTLYYIMKTRGVWCNSCGECQLGLYFTCVACFDNASHTYDLCTDCYSQRRYSHPHISFLDSYELLLSKRGLPPGAPNLNQVVDLVIKAVPLPLSSEDDSMRGDLKNLQVKKEEIDVMAHRQVRQILWSGLGMAVILVGLFFWLTFWEFSWDIMEPIAFFTTTTGMVIGYAYFLFTSRDPTYEDFMQRLFNSRQRKLFKKHDFDVERFKELQQKFQTPIGASASIKNRVGVEPEIKDPLEKV